MAKLRIVRHLIIAAALSHSNIVGAAEIESSFPPNNAIDARAPFAGTAAELQGWQSIEIRFSAAVRSIDTTDFTLSEKGGDGVPPSIVSIEHLDSNTVMVTLSEPLEPGTWLELTHVSSGTSVSLGYLPGDVNGDGTVSPSQDLLALIDCINIPGRCNEWQYDIDRSGQPAGSADRSRLLALMRGAGGAKTWAAVRMPQGVLSALREVRAAKRGTSPSTARGSAEVQIRLDVTDMGPTEFGSVSMFDPAAFTPKMGVPVSPDDQLLVHVWARNNTATEILLRGLQLDPLASSFPYSLFGVDIDTDNEPIDGIPNLWFDYSGLEPSGEELGLFPAAGHPSTAFHTDFSNTLQGNPLIPFVQATVFAAASADPFLRPQIAMPPSQWVHWGAMPITVPTGTASYTIDILNLPNTDDVNFGAVIDFGFGADPGDPVTKFASAAGGMGVSGTIAYAPVADGGGIISYDGQQQLFRLELDESTAAKVPRAATLMYARRKNRYISLDPNNAGNVVALRVALTASDSHPDAVGMIKWIDIPDVEGIAFLSDEPIARMWPESVVHVTGCFISPVASYEVRATDDEGESFTDALVVRTIDKPGAKFWGDTVGAFDGTEWSPPQGITNIDDAVAVIATWQAADGAPHTSVTDVAPHFINKTVNFNDVLFVLFGFQGQPYPFGCPDDPCHDATVSPCP